MQRWQKAVMAVGGSLVLALPGVASAGEPVDPNLGDTVLGVRGGVRYAIDSDPYDPANGGHGLVAAGCGGPAWRLVGVGAAANGPGSKAFLGSLRPTDHLDVDSHPDDGAEAHGLGPAGRSISAWSMCMRDVAIRYRRLTIPDQPTGDRAATVACGPARWHVVSGGVFIATTQSWVGSSQPVDGDDGGSLPDDGWRGTAYDTIGGFGGAEIHAVCVSDVALRYAWGAATVVPPGTARTQRVACGASEHVLGGGVRVVGSGGKARLLASAPFDGSDADAIPDDGWKTRVFNTWVTDRRVTSYAICLG